MLITKQKGNICISLCRQVSENTETEKLFYWFSPDSQLIEEQPVLRTQTSQNV